MKEVKVVIGVASFCSLAAILAIVVVIPQLYSQISQVNSRVMDGVQAFRVDTDSSWADLMEVQITVTPPSRPRQNPFSSIFMRQKRQYGGEMPAHCQCGPISQPSCPPGTPGPPGKSSAG
jgi:hypothetical protein